MRTYDEVVVNDWLGRDPETATVKQNGNTILRASGKNAAHSSRLFRKRKGVVTPQNQVVIIKNTATAILNVLAPKRAVLRLNKNMTNNTNGIVVNVSMAPIGIPDSTTHRYLSSFYHKLDIVLGFAVHEAAHVRLSDFNVLNDLVRRANHPDIMKAVLNILEDERIEKNVSDKYQGYIEYLVRTKWFMFSADSPQCIEAKAKAQAAGATVDEITALINLLLLVVRFPKAITQVEFTTHQKYIDELVTILTPYPETTDELVAASLKVYTLLTNEIVNTDEAKDSSAEDALEVADSIAKDLTDIIDSITNSIPTEIFTSSASPDTPVVSGESANSNEVIGDLPTSDKETTESANIDRDMPDGLETGDFGVHYLEVPKNERYYQEALSAVKPFAATLRHKLIPLNRNQRDVYRGMHEGEFDDEAIVDAVLGERAVYKQTANIKSTGLSVGLLIDESGSMHGSNIRIAREVAVLFSEALLGLPDIEFFCYGHTTGGNDTVIREYFNGRKHTRAEATKLGSIDSYATNRDGHAILEVVGKIRNVTNNPVVIFMLSDGDPSASVPEGHSKMSYTKSSVDFVEKTLNSKVIHIAIDSSAATSAKMFNHHIQFTDHRSTVTNIGNLLLEVSKKLILPETTFE